MCIAMVLFLVSLLSGGQRPEQETVQYENVVDPKEYMLCESFGFYQGSMDMSEITSITFGHTHPESFDETWNADEANSGTIKGYRIGKEVAIIGDFFFANPRCSYMFAACNSYGDPLWSSLTFISGLELLDTSYVEDMKMMFAFTKLDEISGIEQWDVSSVKTFAAMFQGNNNSGDIALKRIDVGEWNTSSAENMSHMFYGCAQVEHFPVENWDVSNVETFSHMFADCYGLKYIDFSKWQTTSVESFDALLNDCRSLTSVDVSGLDTGTCRQFSQMFEYCSSLERIIGLETWDVSNASYYAFSETFHGCSSLTDIDTGCWTATPDNTARMFKGCSKLSRVDISGLNMSKVLYTDEMFDGCFNLK